MITKTLNLDSAYTELFDDIRNKSNGAIDINSVEGFFGNITAIKNLDKKYLRLPLDEPLFEIDANSRRITVPDEFRTNGLSVQGDHLAETVFFSIDRYFDYMDLVGTDVTINWKMGAETGKTDKFIMSADIIPGCIVFGWPVNNVVTQKSGTLTFAVEFCRKDRDGTILYDFNTLAATITIKDGLVIDDVEAISLDNDILAILDDSQFGEGDAVVGPITWITGDGHGLVVGTGPDTSVQLADFSPEINLRTTITEGVPQSVPVNLYAEAFVDNGTEVRYMDMGAGEDIAPIMSRASTELVEVDEIEDGKVYRDASGDVIADPEEAEELYLYEDLDDSLVYYVQVSGSNPVAYRVASAADLEAWNTANQVDLFVKLAKLTASEAGSYFVKAQGQKFDSEGHKIGAGATASSEPVVVPSVERPSEIAIEKSAAPDNSAYSFDEEESANVVFLNNGSATLTASAVVDSFGALQFLWQKKVGDAVSFSNVEEETPAYILENESVLDIDEAGEYKVFVRNFKNGAYTEAVESDVFKASPLAGEITAAQAQYSLGGGEFTNVTDVVQYNSNASSMAQRTIALRIGNVAIDGQDGTLSYEWYIQTGIGEEATRELVSENAVLTITSGDGRFIPVVKNNYNGSIFTYELGPVTVDDIA